jgi:radical SAM superfamily enzyme
MSINELTCLFCLEQSTEDNEVIQFSLYKKIQEMPCTCRFDIHVECWMIYFLKFTKSSSDLLKFNANFNEILIDFHF